ncbi:MAG TPA: OsmC family protein [Longimicrobiales bacterium]|nr:OsmC family protein [Longimicrobiales bacterium]
MDEREFAVSLRLRDGYRFDVDFLREDVPALTLDEPAPLGGDAGPNAVRVLGAAVGNCLAASLLFCLRRSRIEVEELGVDVAGTVIRNERGRFRIGELRVTLHPDLAASDLERAQRCLEIYEDFCIVTQSVRDGLDIQVRVEPRVGAGA